MKILLGVTGSIAAYKALELVRRLTQRGDEVEVALTAAAARFVTPLAFEALTHRAVHTDLWSTWSAERGAREIEHVELAHRIDALVVAPASAHTIARLAHGLADDVITATALSTKAPLVLAPAMESHMWWHPATQANVATLVARGARLVDPGEGALASGRSGVGRLAELEDIVAAIDALARRDLVGRRWVVNAGPTIERLDPVRFLSNRSTGEMGIRIAQAARRRGAEVTLVLGPTALAPPTGVHVVRVESAAEMFAASRAAVEGGGRIADVFVATAAVSDYRPAEAFDAKLKRSDPRAQVLALAENVDILATLAPMVRARGGLVVGFAAETNDVERYARDKLERKGCDLVIANRVGVDVGFGPGQTEVLAVAPGRAALSFGPASKADVADFVVDQISAIGRRP
jgi:phosphopantothenoylcysteine decarboxylase/phosphopantothenate--cysteine ligase